jgi:hypothetical protein
MYDKFLKWYLRVFYDIARVIAGCIAAVTFFAAIGFALDRNSTLDPTLRWGLVGVMAVLGILGVLIVRAPTNRQ